jgi:uncharacterized cysteine cluster protein YcgN (CxxCxxCC family)
MFFKLKQFFYSKILNRKYFREGKCLACGRCCTKIYVRHSKNVIKDEKEFENLKKGHFFYRHLEIIDKDETGLVFVCKRLDTETGKCLATSNGRQFAGNIRRKKFL